MARGIGIYHQIGLILIQVSSVISYVQGGKFEFVKCIWDGSKCKRFEQGSKQPDIEEMVSSWPPGPYAIPKPVDGCPESKLKGWEEGYIDITWQEPHAIFSTSESTSDYEHDPNKSKQFKDVTLTELPSVQSFLLGPYSIYRIKMNFCFKTSRNETLDLETWPHGNYSIYGDNSGCPDGFSSEMISIQLGKVSFFIYDGHLPEFKLNKRDQNADYLEVRLCSRVLDDDHGAIYDKTQFEDHFIFLSFNISPQANQNLHCPSLTGMRVAMETLYLRPNDGSSNLTQFLRFCYFQPETWIYGQIATEQAYTSIPKGTFVVRTSATTGQVSLKSSRVSDRQRDIADILSIEFSPTTQLHWKMLDMGRTLSIFGILLPITVWPVTDETSGEYLSCYYSERQWDFLHFAAPICSFNITNTFSIDSTWEFRHLLEMKRVTEGRYLAFLSGSQDMVNNVLDKDIEMIVLTTYHSHLTDENARCNIDLGMTDYAIDDFQISASSSLPEFPAVNARPFLSSWCADMVDPFPFVLVDLYRTMKVEGITIWNLEHIFETVTDGTLYKSFISIGVRSFSVSYGETENNLAPYVIPVFKLNPLYPVDEPQSFMFAFPFNARFVKVHVLEPLAHNLSCLRFELHGCRKTGIHPWECTTSRILKRVPTLDNIATHPGRLFKNMTLNECNDLCLNKTECCLLQSLPNGDCLHYESSHSKNWKLNTTEANSAVWNAKVCISDYILSPYVAYTITHAGLYYRNISIFTYLSVITEATTLTSIGFPLRYGASESYKWAISFDETDFIKLIFTDVNFNVYTHDKKTNSCQDQLIFNEEKNRFNDTGAVYKRYLLTQNTFLDKKGSFIIDNTFNRKIFATETELSQLYLTFVSCHHTNEIVHRGNGFRAIINKQDVPSCSSFGSVERSNDERLEYCTQPSMFVTSMSYNNVPFARKTEKWTIFRSRGFLRIDVIHFDVNCNLETEFAISGHKYCNLNKPPTVIYTASGYVTIRFTSGNLNDSFRLLYTHLYEIMPESISSRAADIPAIFQSTYYEANATGDQELKTVFLANGPTSLWKTLTDIPPNVPRLLYKACSKTFGKCYSIFSYVGTWDFAGGECWIRQQRLVSISNIEELDLVMYLIRNFKFLLEIDSDISFVSAHRHNKTGFYYTYIGLRRGQRGNDSNAFFWENRTPATFFSWRKGEPSSGDCVRMRFDMANENYTWETHSCFTKCAFYFMCESTMDNTKGVLEERKFPGDYTGNVSVTERGYTCQRWDSQYPHKHYLNKDNMFPDKSVADAANFCRDPRGKYLWCFTTDPLVQTDFCYLNELNEEVSPTRYYGYLDRDVDGSKCLKWSNNGSNYCRYDFSNNVAQQNMYRYIWCYVNVNVDGLVTKMSSPCSFRDTASDRCRYVRPPYRGTWNLTANGKSCQRWDMFFTQDQIYQYQFPDADLREASNYCRDPISRGFLWCYTAHDGKMWEMCTIGSTKYSYGSLAHDDFPTGEYFECNDGQRVDAYKRCNGNINCKDMSDETGCVAEVHPLLRDVQSTEIDESIIEVDPGAYFHCESQEFISFLALCDGVFDCQDASDESNCPQVSQDESVCAKDQFMCDDGNCIHVSLVCNFINDCIDKTDEDCEYPSCSSHEYTCSSRQCISLVRRCNGYPDCVDGTDEDNCDLCSSGAFHCDYVRCLPERLVCDDYPDCQDGRDEMSCDIKDMTSCKEWWEEGFKESGMYTLKVFGITMEVYCDFGSIRQDSELYTVFPNIDIVERDGDLIIFTSGSNDKPVDYVLDFWFSTDGNAKCTQEVVQTCRPPINAAAAVDDPDHVHIYSYCVCLTVTLVIGWEPEISSVRHCNNSQPLDADESKDFLFFTYSYTSNHRVLRWKTISVNFDNIHLQIGNVTCKEDYDMKSDSAACDGRRYVYNASLRCIYDIDSSGLTVGCRLGSHLHSCETFVCPTGTVKCQDSYCIPLRFVCDGVEQCPNAEDEYGCGCKDTEREVLILHEEQAVRGPDITKLAKQLYTPFSIVRRLTYKSARRPKEIPQIYKLLRIKDKEMKTHELTDRNYECEYNVLAHEFLKSVKFTREKRRSILFIQSSPESEDIAASMFANITKKPNITIYWVTESPTSTFKHRKIPFVIDVVVKNWNILSSLAARYLPEICHEAFSTPCPGSYRCSSSKMCITLNQVCDGNIDCIHGDDELLCNFVCPRQCVCKGYAMTCNVNFLNGTDISLFPKETRALETNIDTQKEVTLAADVLDFPFLYLLNFSSCKIKEILPNAFTKLQNLKVLDLSSNLLTKLFPLVFSGLQRLQILNLDGNTYLATLEPYTFQYLQSVKHLRIAGTEIRNVVSNTFAGLNLTRLDLQNNRFQNIEEFGLGNLAVEHLTFQSNLISTFDKGMFTGVSSLKSLWTPAFKYCCVRPNYLPEESCFPHKDEFSSCDDLMRISVLQTMLWLIGLCALLGNILSVIYRLKFDRERLKLGYGIFVTNLAIADFLMGVYLIIIAIADAVFRKRYIFMDDFWRSSNWCTFAGILSTLSSEASVMFLCLITLDRILVIKYPFGQIRFDTKKAIVCSLIAWFLCLMIALFPLMYSAYFMDSFYNKSGVCIALPLTRDRPPGWLYSVSVFVVFNFITFLLIAVGQWSIFTDIRKSGKGIKGQSARKRDLTVARNLLLVVATDFLCWFPIGCTGIMAMSGRVISGDVYAWSAVFVLPVNSALNPVLYTLTAILGKKSFVPRTSEQARLTVRTGLGKRFLINKYIVMRRFYVDEAASKNVYKSLEDALQTSKGVQLDIVLKICYQLAQTLLVLHNNSLKLDKIDEQSLHVKVAGNELLGDVQIRKEPTLCKQKSDTCNDIYKFGLLLRQLMRKNKLKE